MSDLELSDNEIDIMEDEEEVKPTFTVLKGNDTVNTSIDQGLDNDIVSEDDDEDEDENEDEDEDEDDDADDLDDDDLDDDDLDDDINEDGDEKSEEYDEDGNMISTNNTISKKTTKKISKNVSELPTANINIPVDYEKNDSDYDSDDDDIDDNDYLQKFDSEMRQDYLLSQHPESVYNNYDEIYNLAKVHRNKDNIIDDMLHKTIPILTKYEKTRILGIRAKQLNNGAKPMCKIPSNVIDGYLIAIKELEEKSIPVIIRRPMPNGSSEYWHLKDLEIL